MDETPLSGLLGFGPMADKPLGLATKIAKENVRERLFGNIGQATSIGRFSVLEQVGEGGMGAVFSAYDPRLDRRVALKLLRGTVAADSDQARARLIREAQIMARLDHPNIVGVYEVGTHDDSVYVAMEFVQGRTLERWLREERPWHEVVDRFVQAGRGLTAAHAEGILHRDFKPTNVMIDDRGRVRVLDFGLAATEGETHTTLDGPMSEELTPSCRGSLTRTGAVLGTPLYLAPELLERQPATTASDQYSFCVSLWQALYGQHPFMRPTIIAMHAAITSGERPAISTTGNVPTWVREIVERGLEYEPDQRWPSMDALVTALLDDPSRRRRRWRTRMLGVTLVAGIAYGAFHLGDRSEPPCALGPDAVGEVWDGPRRERVELALSRSGVPYAETVVPRVLTGIDSYAEHWLSAARSQCESERAHAMSPAQQERSTMCLVQRRRSLNALIGVLETADGEVMDHAVQAVQTLPAITVCTDPDQLADTAAPPPSPIAPDVARLEDELAAARARLTIDSLDEQQVVVELLERARTLGYAPVIARAEMTHGQVLMASGQYTEAEQVLRDAIVHARSARADVVSREASRLLAHMLGLSLKRPKESLFWAMLAGAEAERAEDELARAGSMFEQGRAYSALGQIDEALERYRTSVALLEAEAGPDSTQLGVVLNSMGRELSKARRIEEAMEVLERALALHERVLGPEHAMTGMTLQYIGLAHLDAGRVEQAIEYQRRSNEVVERRLGPEHPDVAVGYQNLARTLEFAGQSEQALEYTGRALGIWERALGPDHPKIAFLSINLGMALTNLGRNDEALESLDRAYALMNKGDDYLQKHAVSALIIAAGAHRAEGRHDEALATATRALAEAEQKDPKPETLAAAEFEVANSLVAVGQDTPRAMSLACRSRERFSDLGPGYTAFRDEVEAWILEQFEDEPQQVCALRDGLGESGSQRAEASEKAPELASGRPTSSER